MTVKKELLGSVVIGTPKGKFILGMGDIISTSFNPQEDAENSSFEIVAILGDKQAMILGDLKNGIDFVLRLHSPNMTKFLDALREQLKDSPPCEIDRMSRFGLGPNSFGAFVCPLSTLLTRHISIIHKGDNST